MFSLSRRTKSISIALSLILHLAAIGAFAGWAAARVERATFAGQSKAIRLQVAELEPVWQPPDPVAVEISPQEPQVVVEPKHARIAKQHFVDTPTEDVDPAELLAEVPVPPPSAEDAPIDPTEAAEASPPPPDAEPPVVTRHRPPVQPNTSVRASLPKPVGTDARTPPSFLNNSPPQYPEIARRERWEGTVLLRLHIAADGAMERVEVARSSGHEILDGAAVTAVRRWKGQPAMQSGVAIATIELLPVRFRLR